MTQLLTVKELAEKLRCSTFQVYRLTGGRRIPFMRVAGGAIRFSPEEIEDWLRGQRVEPEDEIDTFQEIVE